MSHPHTSPRNTVRIHEIHSFLHGGADGFLLGRGIALASSGIIFEADVENAPMAGVALVLIGARFDERGHAVDDFCDGGDGAVGVVC